HSVVHLLPRTLPPPPPTLSCFPSLPLPHLQGKEIIEFYLNQLEEEGISHVPRWTPSLDAPSSSSVTTKPVCATPKLLHLELPVTPAVSIPVSTDASDHEIATATNNDATQSDATSNDAASQPDNQTENQTGTPDDKLDADYIKRYLGDLTPLQESCLIRLRQWLQESHKGKTLTLTPSSPSSPPFQIPKDEHILRFLRARDFNMEKAREILCQSLTWRKQHQVDYLLETWTSPQVLSDYYTGGWHHHDKGMAYGHRWCSGIHTHN
ncbi:unnamed protein product, partial [Oncorhynchus mykiss]